MSQLLEKADKAYIKKNFDYAITLWLQHLKLKPDDLDTRQKLRKCEREAAALKGGGGGWFSKIKGKVASVIPVGKDPESTMISCEESLKDDPTNKDILFKLGEACFGAGHHETAIWVFKDILGIDKNDLNARRFLARSLKEVGDLEGAINYYEQIRKLDPSDKEAADEVRNLSAQGTSSNMQKRLASGKGYKALVNTDQAAKLERLSARVRTADQARERIIDLKDELEKEPDSTKIMVMISDMHVMLKEWAEAKEWLEKVTEIDPDDFQAKEKLGDLKLKQYDDMIAKLKGAAKKDPSAKAKYEKAVAEKRKFEIEEFRKRFEAHPTELKYAYMLGKALHEAGNHDEAIQELQKAKQDSKYKVDAGYYLGLSLFHKKNLRMSIKELETARSDLFDMDDDNNKKITYLLGRIYESAKKGDKALLEYEKIAEVDYNYKDVQKRMETLGTI